MRLDLKYGMIVPGVFDSQAGGASLFRQLRAFEFPVVDHSQC